MNYISRVAKSGTQGLSVNAISFFNNIVGKATKDKYR